MAGLEEREGSRKIKTNRLLYFLWTCDHIHAMLVYVVCKKKDSRVLQRLTCSGSARCQRMHLPL